MQDRAELVIDSAQCSFWGKQILNSVYLNCRVGETVGILGRNGAGKSVLLKMIFGIVKGQFKHLTVKGKRVDKGYLTKEIAYLPQDRLFPPDCKVDFLVELMTNIYREKLLRNEYIQKYLNMKLKDLPDGVVRYIETLLILYTDSTFVLLDEPFAHVAPILRDDLIGEIQKLKDTKGIIVTDHNYREILAISDRIVLIHNGSNYQIKNEQDLATHGYISGL